MDVVSQTDRPTIRDISAFFKHMSLYANGDTMFEPTTSEQQVVDLMSSHHIPAICISYKHTRGGKDNPEDVTRDENRVKACLHAMCDTLLIPRVLFCCDLVNPTDDNDGVPWARHGVDPYLCMPCIRVISVGLAQEIEDSFWISVEKTAVTLRGGFVTYDEDQQQLLLTSTKEETFAIPSLHMPFMDTKRTLGCTICSPLLYYKKARYDSDKDEVLKYAVEIFVQQYSQTPLPRIYEHFELDEQHLTGFFSLVALSPTQGFLQPNSRPNYFIDKWNGVVSFFPGLKLLQQNQRDFFEAAFRVYGTKVKRNGEDRMIDGLTPVLCQSFMGGNWCTTLLLLVHGFEDEEGKVRGTVRKFRVATEQEEQELRNSSEHKCKVILFDSETHAGSYGVAVAKVYLQQQQGQ